MMRVRLGKSGNPNAASALTSLGNANEQAVESATFTASVRDHTEEMVKLADELRSHGSSQDRQQRFYKLRISR
jgi:hypothetical protein